MKPYAVLRLGDDDNSTAIGGGGSGAITFDIYAYVSEPVLFGVSYEQATCIVSLNSNGTIGGSISGAWYATPTVGIGSSYWVIVTITTGAVTTGTTGSRASLASGQEWTVVTSGVGRGRTSSAVGTIQIWDAASGGNMVSSGTFTMTAHGEVYYEPALDGSEPF